MRLFHVLSILYATTCMNVTIGFGQTYGQPDRGQPGDEMIQEYLAREAGQIHEKFMRDIGSRADWEASRPRYQQEYLHMLGLWPTPGKSPLEATITGTLAGDGYVVEMLHYQSVPKLYVTANLYRPAQVAPGQRLPAVLYVCGHSFCGRNGNKTAYQSHGMWFARHGYVCLVLDTLQLGEIAALHHGTYREGRWWWHARGYTPAGVECLNGIRGIDYLLGRPDVDPQRIAVTGISGGGAATFWIAAADERVKIAVPVSGMADLPSYVSNRVINGHCDCMFLYNTFQWPWARIAALIAPRALLFINSDQDAIFPMDANQRVINRLERLYSLYGAGDFVDSFVSIGGHAYRQDIRQAAYRFINMHLQNEARVVADSEVDLVTGPSNKQEYPIAPEKLRVFPQDSDIPRDELNTTIDRHFVPLAQVSLPEKGGYQAWRAPLLAELRRVAFGYFPERIEPAQSLGKSEPDGEWLASEQGIRVHLQQPVQFGSSDKPTRILLAVRNLDPNEPVAEWVNRIREPGDRVYVCAPRGVDQTCWTRKNPPNYVERSHVLLGRTVDTGRVWDIIAAARHLHSDVPVYLAGKGPAAVLAAYAALWEPEIAGVIAVDPPSSHMDAEAPQFLNVLRVCDIPDVFGMLAPRPLTLHGYDDAMEKAARIYAAAEASDKLVLKRQPAESLPVYLGTYTGGGDSAKGIYRCVLNLATGELSHPVPAAEARNPSFLEIHPSGRFLYAVSEAGPDGSVSAYAIDADTGVLRLLNHRPSGGAGPCHVSIDHAGRNVLVANYGSGSASVIPIESDGRLAEPSGLVQHEGSGPNPERQKGPHAHSINVSPDNRFAFVADLGIDKVMIYRLDIQKGTITANHTPFVQVKPGAGPRHFAFHPDGKHAYVINELDCTMTAFTYDSASGALTEFQTLTTLPKGYAGSSTCAEVRVHPSGRFLYGSNRGHDSIVVYRIDPAQGTLTLVEHETADIKTPRNFNIDPTGRFCLVANQGGDSVIVFRINHETGAFEPTGHKISVPRPVCIRFLRPSHGNSR